MEQVYIVAGGPGDPGLVTLKGQQCIESADIIFTSAHFTQPKVFKNKKAGCRIYDHFEHSADEKIEIIKNAVQNGEVTVFVTMGDPCLYGMMGGISDRLEKSGISYEIVPGVSAFNACSALLKRGMTGLGLPNTAICTTLRDRQDAEEYIEKIAALQASMAVFMSVEFLDRLTAALMRYYPEKTAVVVVSRATWPEQQIVRGNLLTIERLVRQQNIADGLILIGDFIDKEYDYAAEKEFMARKRTKGPLPGISLRFC